MTLLYYNMSIELNSDSGHRARPQNINQFPHKKAIHSPSVLILTCCRTVSDFRQWKLSTQRPLNAMPTEKNGLSIDLAFQISDIQSSQRFGSKRKKKKPGFLCSPQSLKRRITVLGHWYQRLVHKFELSGVKTDFDQHQGQRDY